jgi:cysteine desulfurase/selenocysteine lyase
VEVYLDAAATSRRKPEAVYEAMDHFMRRVGASPGRSVHGPGIAASRIVAGAREKLAQLLGAGDPSRIVFTLNCTEALNLAIKGTLKPNSHVVTSGVEHNSVMRPLSAMAQERGMHVSRARADAGGTTNPDDLKKCIRPETALIVMTHASNVTGAIQPIEECGRAAQSVAFPSLWMPRRRPAASR